MDEKSLYAHILNLTAPWQVKSLTLDENAGSVTVTVGIAENIQLTCPTCKKSCSVHDHRHRKWRHLDTCQFMTLVEADVPRVMCPEHGCQTLPVPWAGPGSRYTLLFKSFVLSWLKISTVDAVRKQLKLSWNVVDGIMTRAVKRGQLLAKVGQSLSGMVKVTCCHSQSGRMCCCSAIHCSVAFMPQALQPSPLQLRQMYLVWEQWGEVQQYRREPMVGVPQASMRSMTSWVHAGME